MFFFCFLFFLPLPMQAGETPLFVAIQCHDVVMCNVLLGANADLLVVCPDGRTCLEHGCESSSDRISKMFKDLHMLRFGQPFVQGAPLPATDSETRVEKAPAAKRRFSLSFRGQKSYAPSKARGGGFSAVLSFFKTAEAANTDPNALRQVPNWRRFGRSPPPPPPPTANE